MRPSAIGQTIVVFDKHGAARLLKSYHLPALLHGSDTALLNPDLSRVSGVPPHLWKLVDGEIVPMTEKERLKREAQDIPGPSADRIIYPAIALFLSILAVVACHHITHG